MSSSCWFRNFTVVALCVHCVMHSCLRAQAQDERIDGQNLAEELDAFEDEDSLFKYEPNPNRVRLKSVVSEQAIARFNRGEPINIQIPFGKDQIISSLQIKKFECFKPAPLQVKVNSRVKGNDVLLDIPAELMYRLDYQPIQVDVFQSNVNRVVLVPTDEKAAVGPAVPQKSINPDFYVRLKPNNGVAVAFKNKNVFKLTNDILDVNFPFQEIEGIFFDEDENDSASIVMRNGDNISGQHHWPAKVEFETPWGNETIDLDQVVSVTRDRATRLVPSGAANPRWVIVHENR